MATVKICFIGAGKMANSVHYPSVSTYPGANIIGVCDLDGTRAHETAVKYSIPHVYTDYQKMLRDLNPDGIFVIAPPQHMYDIVKYCLDQGFPVFCEKPLGLNLHQTTMLAELAVRNGLITQVGHQRRSSPVLNFALDECLKRGPIHHAVCEFYKCDSTPMFSACDHIHDDCSHAVDTLRYLCMGKVVDVRSECKRTGNPDINWVMAMLHFDNGSTGMLINSWVSGRRVFRVEIHAPSIYSDVELEKGAYIYADGDYNGKNYDTKQIAGSEELFVFGGFRKKHAEFIDSIATGIDTTSSPFSDVLETMAVVETILAQNLLNRR